LAINYALAYTVANASVRALASSAMGHWGTCPSSTSNCLTFLVTSEPHKLRHSTSCGCLSSKNIQAYSFVTIYCMNCKIFCLAPLNYLLLVSCPSSHQILVTPLFS